MLVGEVLDEMEKNAKHKRTNKKKQDSETYSHY